MAQEEVTALGKWWTHAILQDEVNNFQIGGGGG